MAALPDHPPRLEILDLRHFQARDLAPLLDEESRVWRQRLRWDFGPSRDLVCQYLDMRSLDGYALLCGRAPIGYTYYVPEDHKALIGDLYVAETYRTPEAQQRLVRCAVESARRAPGVRRIEAQLMMLESAALETLFPAWEMSTFERNFMLVEGIGALSRDQFGRVRDPDFSWQAWSEWLMEPAAHLIARCYQQHVDSRINDQYQSVPGARRFLHNITQYPGCGAFHRGASLAALNRWSGELCGISLGSLVAPAVGHITQICVTPHLQGRGIGSELLWRAIEAFRQAGCQSVTLTVTANNRGAGELYERVGFRTLRQFRAYVWEGFRP